MADTTILDRVRMRWQHEGNWPPPHVKKGWDRIEGYRKRYRNDRDELIAMNPNISTDNHKIEIYVPVPWPRELCRFSAALLFSESPRVTIGGTEDDQLKSLIKVNDFGAFAIRGGVTAAAEGRVGIRIIRDDDLSPQPLLTIVNDDQIIWDLRHGSFYNGGMVIVERKVREPNKEEVWYRLLEEHSPGLIKRTLYKGTSNELGKPVPLDTLLEFENLLPEEDTGLDKPTLIPWENVPMGESDLFGLGPIFDDINEQESLLLDRIRKTIPHVFVDRSLADETGRLDIEGYILTGGARMRLPLGDTPGSTVEVAQPNLQNQEAIAGLDHITQLMVTCAGYSPSTWGIQGQTASIQRAVSGYAMKLSQLRTLLNRSAKEHMALEALGWSVATAMAWEKRTNDVSAMLPLIELGDGLPADPLDGAQEVLFLSQALAASTETLVKTVHPTWTEKQVQDEVDLIVENAAAPPGAGPALGLGKLPKHVRDALGVEDDRAGAGNDPAPTT